MKEHPILDILGKYIKKVKETQTGEIIYRCPICGDSKKEYTGHLYVNKESFNYICFKCGVKGKNIVQFVYNLIQDGTIPEYDVKDEQEMLKYIFKKLQRQEKSEKNIEELQKITLLKQKKEEEDLIKCISDEELFMNTLKKKRNYQEQFVIDSVIIPYYKQRTVGQENLQRYLVENNKVFFYYSDVKEKIESYSPSILLNRIYFNHGNSFYSQRKISEFMEGEDKDSKRYLLYHSKSSKKMNPFIIQLIDDSDVYAVYLTEGIFDSIKLHSFLSYETQNFATYTLNGKILHEELLEILKSKYKNLNKIVLILDRDVLEKDIKASILKFNNIFDSNKTELLIGTIQDSEIKDIGEMIAKEQLKSIKLDNQNNYELSDIFIKLDKVRNFFSGVQAK